MKLEQNDSPILFSNTELPDIFFTEYLSQTDGNYIKVYLYMIFLSKYGKDIKINDLSKKLQLDFKVIQDAIKYWEELGVITKKNTGYIINNVQGRESAHTYCKRVEEGSCMQRLAPEEEEALNETIDKWGAIYHV